jgi:hypothetical protein
VTDVDYTIIDAFLSTPTSELERFGLDEGTLRALEASVGLYVRDFLGVSVSHLMKLDGIGRSRAVRTQAAVQCLYTSLVANGGSGDAEDSGFSSH